MQELTKIQIDEVMNITNSLLAIGEKMNAMNEKLQDEVAKYNEVVQQYNNMLHNARGIRDALVERMDAYMEEKGGQWQNETDEGVAYEEWRNSWAEIDLDPIEVIDDPTLVGLGHAEELENLSHVP